MSAPQGSPGGESQEVQLQCAVLQALLLLVPLTEDAGTSGGSRDPTSALVRALYPVVRQVSSAASRTTCAARPFARHRCHDAPGTPHLRSSEGRFMHPAVWPQNGEVKGTPGCGGGNAYAPLCIHSLGRAMDDLKP